MTRGCARASRLLTICIVALAYVVACNLDWLGKRVERKTLECGEPPHQGSCTPSAGCEFEYPEFGQWISEQPTIWSSGFCLQTGNIGELLIISLQPGETAEFATVRWACCVYPVRVQSPCVTWRVEPPETGTISADGSFALDAGAQVGQQVTIIASVPGSCELHAVVTVFDFATDPLVGRWYEQAALLCDGTTDTQREMFGELDFAADGQLSLTWFPLEIRTDYRGVYRYDHQTKQLEMNFCGGNPANADLTGYLEIQPDGTIQLFDLSFGLPPFGANPESQAGPQTCGYIIKRH